MSASAPPAAPPMRSGGGRRVAWIAVGWLLWVSGCAFLGVPVFIWLFGAPVDAPTALLVAFVADTVLLAVLVVGIVVSSPRRLQRGNGWAMFAADAVVLVGFIVAAVLQSSISYLR